MSYLIMPVQRIPRYQLLLRELDKVTEEGHPEKQHLGEALQKIEHIAKHVNEEKRNVNCCGDDGDGDGVGGEYLAYCFKRTNLG